MQLRAWSLALSLLLAASAAAAQSAAGPAPSADPGKRLTVRLRGDPQTVFTKLGDLYGVRVLVDEGFPRRALTLRLDDADFPTALRAATELASAFWVELDDRTLLVAANTPEKHRQFEPQVVQTFSLPGRTPEELAEAVRLLREVFDMRRIQTDTRTNTFTVRDTPERVALATRFLEQLSRERGEILVDVLLLEVDRERARQLGLLPPREAVIIHLGTNLFDLSQVESLISVLRVLLERGLIPERFLGVSLQTLLAALATDPSQVLASLPPFVLFGGGATVFAASLPGARASLLDFARVTHSLRRVTLRAPDAQEASLFIGEQFPVVLATFSSLFFPPQVLDLIKQGLFVPPVPAVQYQDLGLKLTAQPFLHSGREITLRMKLDLRSLTPSTLNSLPIFSNRIVEQTVRLKAGEAFLLGGILSETHQETREGVPGLGQVPVLNFIFSRRERQTRETELILLVTPRIVRPSLLEEKAPAAVYVGTEARFSPFGAVPAPPARTPPAQPPPPQTQPPRPN